MKCVAEPEHDRHIDDDGKDVYAKVRTAGRPFTAQSRRYPPPPTNIVSLGPFLLPTGTVTVILERVLGAKLGAPSTYNLHIALVLDTFPLSSTGKQDPFPGATPTTLERCNQWVRDCVDAGNVVIAPAISYYETLRELERLGATAQIARLRIVGRGRRLGRRRGRRARARSRERRLRSDPGPLRSARR